MKDDNYIPARVIEKTDDYEILEWSTGEQGIYCWLCGWISYHPGDIEHRYCAHCKRFHSR